MRRLLGLLVALPTMACSVAPYSARIVDADGATLSTTSRDGRVVVSGRQGQTYGIAIENSTAEPVAAVIAIDGIDAGNGQIVDPSPSERLRRSSWGLEAYTHTTVDGFALSNGLDSLFRLADAKHSIAAQIGNPEHIGIIEVAIFKAVPVDPQEVISLDFARTRTQPSAPALGTTPVPATEEPAPVFGELRSTKRTTTAKYELDRSANARELQRFVFVIEGARAERLGTVGPPLPARATADDPKPSLPLAHGAEDDAREDPKSPKPEKRPKPIKGSGGKGPPEGPKAPTKAPKPGKSSEKPSS